MCQSEHLISWRLLKDCKIRCRALWWPKRNLTWKRNAGACVRTGEQETAEGNRGPHSKTEKAEGNILDDEVLINTLSDSKRQRTTSKSRCCCQTNEKRSERAGCFPRRKSVLCIADCQRRPNVPVPRWCKSLLAIGSTTSRKHGWSWKV